MIRILIADDHAIVRRGLRQIVDEHADIEIIEEAETGAEAIDIARRKELDVVVLDISLPDRNGLDVMEQIHSIQPKLPLLILSMHPEEKYALRMMRAGAAGYVDKQAAPQLLVTAIRRVAEGGRYMSPAMTEKAAFEAIQPAGGEPHERLSDREFQVMMMLVAGKTVTEIAGDLGVSVKTVSTHRTRLLEKMDMKNNAELIHYAIRRALV